MFFITYFLCIMLIQAVNVESINVMQCVGVRFRMMLFLIAKSDDLLSRKMRLTNEN